MLGDELSPDNFRLRDMQTGAVLDKDVFRLDLGDLGETYRVLLARLEQPAKGQPAQGQNDANRKQTYTGEVFVHSRKNILNPESKAILEGLHVLGYENVETLSAGKRFVIRMEAESLVAAEQQEVHPGHAAELRIFREREDVGGAGVARGRGAVAEDGEPEGGGGGHRHGREHHRRTPSAERRRDDGAREHHRERRRAGPAGPPLRVGPASLAPQILRPSTLAIDSGLNPSCSSATPSLKYSR